MRVLFLAHAWAPYHCGGAEMMAHTMMRDLVKHGHEVDVLLSVLPQDAPLPYELDGVRVWPRSGKADATAWLHDDARKPDVLISHLENVSRAGVLGKMYRVPTVQLVHNTFSLTSAVMLSHPPTLAVFNTEHMAKHFADVFARRGEKLPHSVIVHPPVWPHEYALEAPTPGDSGAVTLVNLYRPKGSELFYKLAESMPRREFLGVTGGYGDQDVRQLPNVEISPHVPGSEMAAQVYSRTRVLLVPSDYESYGRVAAEAMCAGLPVIAHPTPGLRECLGDAGIFVDREDPQGWADALRALDKPATYRKACAASRARAAQLDPAPELAAFRDALEGGPGARTRHRR